MQDFRDLRIIKQTLMYLKIKSTPAENEIWYKVV